MRMNVGVIAMLTGLLLSPIVTKSHPQEPQIDSYKLIEQRVCDGEGNQWTCQVVKRQIPNS